MTQRAWCLVSPVDDILVMKIAATINVGPRILKRVHWPCMGRLELSQIVRLVLRLPGYMSLREGTLLEPTSIAVHMSKLNVSIGNPAVVCGAGTLGLLCGAVTRY